MFQVKNTGKYSCNVCRKEVSRIAIVCGVTVGFIKDVFQESLRIMLICHCGLEDESKPKAPMQPEAAFA